MFSHCVCSAVPGGNVLQRDPPRVPELPQGDVPAHRRTADMHGVPRQDQHLRGTRTQRNGMQRYLPLLLTALPVIMSASLVFSARLR